MQDNERENRLRRRLMRRLLGSRASAYLEFAVISPLAIGFMCFAADFTRILYVEQQLEIGARLAADIQSRHAFDENSKVTDKKVKVPVQNYLAKIIGTDKGSVYLKAKVFTNQNVLTCLVKFLDDTFFNSAKINNFFWNMLTRFLGKVVYALTFGTDAYIRRTIPGDRGVKVTCSCAIETLLPPVFYSFYMPRSHDGWLHVVQAAPEKSNGHIDPTDNKTTATSDIGVRLKTDERYRFWVSMPSLDTAPVSYETMTDKIRGWPLIRKFVTH